MNTPESYQTPRTTVHRLPQRGIYDRAAVHEILDAGMICHVGFVMDGQPFVIPTIYVRIGERVCVHGSRASRMLRALASGIETCITVTLVDGLVLARSAFHHSIAGLLTRIAALQKSRGIYGEPAPKQTLPCSIRCICREDG